MMPCSASITAAFVPVKHDMNLRRKGQRVALADVLHAYGGAGGLRRAKFDLRIGRRVSGFAVEYQISRLQVNRILQFLGRGLISAGEARRVRHQIDLYVAFGGDVAGFLVVGKIVAVNLVEARGIAAVEHDADVVQFGVSVKFELFHVACLDGEQRALSIGLGKLKPVGRLLESIPILPGILLQHVGRPQARVEIHPCHHQREQDGGRGQQTAQTIDLERHLVSV